MISKIKNKLAVLFCAIIPLFSYAQNEGPIPKVTPVSPNSAALFKSMALPPGTFTGTASVDIPLFSFGTAGIQVPVQMVYQTGALKVEEIASWTGLGWNLTAGGRVTRSVNGLPDDKVAGGMMYAYLKPSEFPGSDGITAPSNVVGELLDVQPDIFYFNAGNISGKFFINEDADVKLVSQDALDIDYVIENQIIVGWIITDAKGFKYYFGKNKAQTVAATDQTSIVSGGAPNPVFISAWHLLEIRDMNDQNVVKFTYQNTFTTFTTRSGNHQAYTAPLGSATDCIPSDYTGQEVDVTTDANECYLAKIETVYDSLRLYSSGNRKDFSGGRRLDSITLFQKNKAIKGYHFFYSYFTQDGVPQDQASDYVFKRLKLTEIAEFGTTRTDSMSYRFEYVETVNLPSRMSKAIDYWGYYNGAHTNMTLIPSGVFKYQGYTYIIKNDERRANPAYGIANTLKKVYFPTGGYREFSFEGNQVLLDYYDNQIDPDAGINQYIPAGFNNTNFSSVPVTMPAASQSFVISNLDGGSYFNWELIFSDPFACSSNDVTVKILNSIGHIEVISWQGQYNNGMGYYLSNGNYYIEVYLGAGCGLSTTNTIKGSWFNKTNEPPLVNRYNEASIAANNGAGGIRIKEVTDYDPVTDKSKKIKFKYNLFADSTLTSGVLVSPVRPWHKGGCPEPYRFCNYFRLSESSHYPLATHGSSYVVYPEVRTFEEGNGYIDRTFYFAYDAKPLSLHVDSFPIVPLQDNSLMRGDLKWEHIYNQAGQKLAETYNEKIDGSGPYYDENAIMMMSTQLAYKVVGYPSQDPETAGMIDIACWQKYLLKSRFNPLLKTIQRTFSDNGGLSTEVISQYDYYTTLGRPALKEERVYLNNGKIKKTNYKYAFNAPGDFILGLSSQEQLTKDTLLVKNYMLPIEVVTTIGKEGGTYTLSEASKTSYSSFGPSVLHVSAVKQYTSLTAYREAILTGYDNAGNIGQLEKADGIKEVYLWGYNAQYPVAKIIGSDYATVNSVVSQAQIDAAVDDDAGLRALLHTLRTHSNTKNAFTTSYTYAPLVGMTSETDPNGKTTYYEYDHFNRLSVIRDQDNKILKKICYNYAGMVENCTGAF